ncbi:glutathione S-transferase family protein [Ottowia sp.]|uniref:glutathione S-transferase family protein n=1 Tax=Ottowia sp. TaxID=1898956 RepID=UPI00392A386C
MITLYDYELSGNCYKVRLFLEILKIPYVKHPVEFYPGFEHKSDALLALNPLGQLPILDDAGFVMRDAQAILSYLAQRYAPGSHWYPVLDARRLGETNMWLAFANELTATSSAARLQQLFEFELDADKARRGAYRLFRILDEHLWLSERQPDGGWLCTGGQPTIADLACFPYVMLAPEGGISLLDFPALRRWTDRVKRIAGFTVMAGIFPASPSRQQAPTEHGAITM